MQAFCFAVNGRWQEEELENQRKQRWRPELAQEGKGGPQLEARLAVLPCGVVERDLGGSTGGCPQSERENQPKCEI